MLDRNWQTRVDLQQCSATISSFTPSAPGPPESGFTASTMISMRSKMLGVVLVVKDGVALYADLKYRVGQRSLGLIDAQRASELTARECPCMRLGEPRRMSADLPTASSGSGWTVIGEAAAVSPQRGEPLGDITHATGGRLAPRRASIWRSSLARKGARHESTRADSPSLCGTTQINESQSHQHLGRTGSG